MIDLNFIRGLRLSSGFTIISIELSSDPLKDALSRPAIAKTQISGLNLLITIRSRLSDEECSVTIYHEILEAMTVAIDHPPDTVIHFNENDFERAAYDAQNRFGFASPKSLNRMLQFYGFKEK
jgi:hypothetical protein